MKYHFEPDVHTVLLRWSDSGENFLLAAALFRCGDLSGRIKGTAERFARGRIVFLARGSEWRERWSWRCGTTRNERWARTRIEKGEGGAGENNFWENTFFLSSCRDTHLFHGPYHTNDGRREKKKEKAPTSVSFSLFHSSFLLLSLSSQFFIQMASSPRSGETGQWTRAVAFPRRVVKVRKWKKDGGYHGSPQKQRREYHRKLGSFEVLTNATATLDLVAPHRKRSLNVFPICVLRALSSISRDD